MKQNETERQSKTCRLKRSNPHMLYSGGVFPPHWELHAELDCIWRETFLSNGLLVFIQGADGMRRCPNLHLKHIQNVSHFGNVKFLFYAKICCNWKVFFRRYVANGTQLWMGAKRIKEKFDDFIA